MAVSLLAMLDDYIRKCQLLYMNDCNKEFLTFVRNQMHCRQQWNEAVEECVRLKCELDKSHASISDMERKLNRARMILHEEKERATAAETERDELRDQVQQIQSILDTIRRAGDQLANETKEKLDRILNNTHIKARRSDGLYPKLDPIDEVNSTGDLLSDVSMSRSYDTISLDSSERISRIKKPRRSDVQLDEAPSKRRRSARLSACGVKASNRDHLVATTTVTVPKQGPIIAESRIESKPAAVLRKVESEAANPTFYIPSAPPLPSITSSSDSDTPLPHTPRVNHFTRPHDLIVRTVLKPSEECCACSKTMNFASKVVRCGECKASAHLECRDAVPVPCMPNVATPRGDRALRLVDYVGAIPPLVPPILVRCVLEIERRGLNELGLYRVPGSEKDVRALRTRFQRGKGACSLTGYDVHVICGVLKDFLRSLPEPVITHAQWEGFTSSVDETAGDRSAALYQQVVELPPANRDTLAYIMLHLLRVSQSPPCKMSITNLATVFGPTLVGYSSAAPTNQQMCNQTPLQARVVESLLELGEDYWRNIIQKTPSTPITPKYSFRRKGKN